MPRWYFTSPDPCEVWGEGGEEGRGDGGEQGVAKGGEGETEEEQCVGRGGGGGRRWREGKTVRGREMREGGREV